MWGRGRNGLSGINTTRKGKCCRRRGSPGKGCTMIFKTGSYRPKGVPGSKYYAYAPNNRRIWKKKPNGTEEIYYYGISGQKLGTYTPSLYLGVLYITTADQNLYFGSKIIVSKWTAVARDRL